MLISVASVCAVSEWDTHRLPSENVLGNVRWFWGIPLDRVRIGLTGGLGDDYLDGTSCA